MEEKSAISTSKSSSAMDRLVIRTATVSHAKSKSSIPESKKSWAVGMSLIWAAGSEREWSERAFPQVGFLEPSLRAAPPPLTQTPYQARRLSLWFDTGVGRVRGPQSYFWIWPLKRSRAAAACY